MKLQKGLLLFLILQHFVANKGFGLTLAECDQTGATCVCIAFPGSDTVCTHSKQTSLMVQKQEKEKWSLLYKKHAPFEKKS